MNEMMQRMLERQSDLAWKAFTKYSQPGINVSLENGDEGLTVDVRKAASANHVAPAWLERRKKKIARKNKVRRKPGNQ